LQGAEINEAKKVLAFETTAILHGKGAATEAAETARRTFEEGEAAEGLPIYTANDPTGEGIPLYMLLSTAGFAKSNGEGRRLIKEGGARVNDTSITDEQFRVRKTDMRNGVVKISKGKKNHALISITDHP
jgi:tyrosyl-tRNA synthetase